jgi:hypothetical protein
VDKLAEGFGRRKGDILNMAATYPVIGSTEEAAKCKELRPSTG